MRSSKKILNNHGLNCTRMQIAALEVLIQAKRPLSRNDILNSLKDKNPDKITIYRILERFCEKGILHKAYLDKRAWEYELADNCTDSQCHPHFKCVNCGKVTCLIGLHVPLVRDIGENFVVQRQKLMIEGIGPECAAGFSDT